MLSENVKVAAAHLEQCAACREELAVRPERIAELDSYVLGEHGDHRLTANIVHRIVFYGLTPLWDGPEMEELGITL